jgi:hypothetical protein
MRRPPGLIVLAIASAAQLIDARIAAAQDCPTAESATRGFVVERQERSKTEVLFAEQAIVRTIMRYDGKTLLETTQFQGLFDLDRLDRGRRAVFRPKTDLAALFPLKAGKKATVEFEVEGAGRPSTAAIQISVKGTDVLYIGSCKYSVLKIERSESQGGSAFGIRGTDYYSPDLKLIIAKEYKDSDTRTTLIKYDRIYPTKQ